MTYLIWFFGECEWDLDILYNTIRCLAEGWCS